MIDPRAAGPRSVVDDEGWGFILRIVAAFTRPQGTEKNENAWFDLLVGETYETGRKFSAAPVGPPLLTRMRVRAQPKKTNFENFGRNSRYLRIPGNRLCPRAKRGRPASAATPKAQITDFAEVSPGFYYRPQRIMDSVPFCGVPKSR